MAGGAVFKLGSFGNFSVFKKGAVGHRGKSHRGVQNGRKLETRYHLENYVLNYVFKFQLPCH